MAVMYRICGWCGAKLDPPTVEVPDNSPTAGTTTHGICDDCKVEYDRKLAELANEKKRMIATGRSKGGAYVVEVGR